MSGPFVPVISSGFKIEMESIFSDHFAMFRLIAADRHRSVNSEHTRLSTSTGRMLSDMIIVCAGVVYV